MTKAKTSDADEGYLPKVTQLPAHTSPSREFEALDEARAEGRGFFWAGLGAAGAWWIAAFAGLFLIAGSGSAPGPSPALLVALCVALAVPGILILMAGLLAQAHARAAATNAIVLEAAARLMMPLETSGKEARTFADQMKAAAGEVDRSMAHALSSMKAMSGEINDERQRLETVSAAAAKNAGLLSDRLHREREALEKLAADIQHQSDLMSEAIPRQAEQMQASARQAAMDLAEADQELETRLNDLKQASTDLIERAGSLDTMSVEATKRSEALIFAVSRMEEKLEQSRKMVDQALRASEMVAASASTTGDRITEAVSAAMDNARTASRDIQAEAREAAEKAAESLAALKRAGEEAAETVRQARIDADALSRFQSRPPATSAPTWDGGPPRQEVTARPDAAKRPDTSPDEDVFEAKEPSPTRRRETGRRETSPDGDLFDAGSEKSDTPEQPGAESEESAQSSPPIALPRRWRDRTPPYLKPVGGSEAVDLKHEDEEEPETDTNADATPLSGLTGDEPAKREHWSNILAEISEDERSDLPREENAEKVIQVLMDSGIRLTEVFRPRDKKKIASAARKGEGTRRKAVVDIAARQVQRVQKHLDSDGDLMLMAREFLIVEESDALMALDKTSHSSKNASARLSAFLLIDAAMG